MIDDKIKHLLLFVEKFPDIESLDISSTTNSSTTKFPSQEFGDFIELLTK